MPQGGYIMYLKNKENLLSHGHIRGRKIALEVVETALEAIDPYKATKALIKLDNDLLRIGSLLIDLTQRGEIYVLGAGKATFPIAKALEEILGQRITNGVIIEKRNVVETLNQIEIVQAGHPIPDKNGLKGSKKILKLAKEAKEGDLVFCPITGGSSALMPLPAEGISLEDKKLVTELLLRSGAIIQEINAVRKHLSAIKGGRLAVAVHPAEVFNLTVSDVIGDWAILDCITGPTVPDTSTFQEAVMVLEKYEIWDHVPNSIRTHLMKADPRWETPKDFTGMKVHTFMLATNTDACNAAKKRAEELGLNAAILSTMIEGESREIGIGLAGIAKEIEQYNRPFNIPCVLVSGGEMTVTIDEEFGEGGPNQEFVLGAALKIDKSNQIVVVSLDTDGTDGPTNIAGGIVDGQTLQRARMAEIDIFAQLRRHNASYVLKKLDDAIFTGPTGTNVMNLRVIVVTSPSSTNTSQSRFTD